MFRNIRLLITVLFFLAGFSFSTETFVSQFFVDSLVDNAMFKFYSRSDPSSGITHADAIKHAKGIATKLRAAAENDVNKKYILAKATELENQIYLEENELTMEKNQWSQKKVNELILEFNSALGADRPDFAKLSNIKLQLKATNAAKDNQLDQSFKNRALSFGKVIPSLIEELLNKGKFIDAQRELSYCAQNAPFIGLSASELARLEAKVLSKSNASNTIKLVKDSFDSLKTFTLKLDFKNGHRLESFLKYQVDFLKRELTSSEWTRYSSDIQVASRKISSKEDSLVAIAERLIKNGRIVDAGSFIDTLHLRGVSNDKLSLVNKNLLESLLAQKQNQPDGNIYALDIDTATANPILSDLVLAAKSKAATDRENARKESDEKVMLTQIAEVRKQRNDLSLEMQKKRSEARRNSDSRKAYDAMVDIFQLLEKDQIGEAQKYYANVKKHLTENLSPDDILKLESILNSPASASK